MKIVSIDDQNALAELLRKVPCNTAAFRGHGNASWMLESHIERTARLRFGAAFRQYLPAFEAATIDNFIERCNRFELADIYSSKALPHHSNTLEWLSLMQHYGNPTRLIDFTSDIWVALYFALQPIPPEIPFAIYELERTDGNKLPKDANGNPFRIPAAQNTVNVNDLLGLAINFQSFRSYGRATQLSPEWMALICKQNFGWDEPFYKNARIKRQAGNFLYQLWLDGRIEEISSLTKYQVSAKLRGWALDQLQKKGLKYTRGFLFPSFDLESSLISSGFGGANPPDEPPSSSAQNSNELQARQN